MRFATAGLVLGALFARRRPLAGVRDGAVWPRLLLMGLVDAFTLLLFFVAIRWTSVAIAHVPAVPRAGLGGAARAARFRDAD